MADAASEAARARKRARNRRDYEASKSGGDHVLLRLDRGGAGVLDQAAARAGLSRAAFARAFLPAIVGAVAARLGEIEAARAAGGRSFAQFLAQAIDRALSDARAASPAAPAAAAEFDALFGGEA